MPVSPRRLPSGLTFWIHVAAGAKREAVGGTRGDALRVAVQAPPVEGRANVACVKALAGALGVKRSEVVLDPGARGRRKRVQVAGNAAELAARLAALAGEC